MPTDLSPYLINSELIGETAQQVIKDFSFYGTEITFSGDHNKAWDELFQQVQPLIAKLIHHDYKKLLEVLYRIDVSEAEVSKAVNTSSTNELSTTLTTLILRRELQKVVTRKMFGK